MFAKDAYKESLKKGFNMKTNIEKEWEFKTLKLSELVPNKENPRTISQNQFEKLKKKIQRQGFRSMFVLDENNTILGGNQRYAALKALGYMEQEVPVAVPLFQLTDKLKQEIIITDNVSDGEWDMEMLANLYDQDDLIEWGLDLPWKEEPIDEENPEQKEFDEEKHQVKIIFKYKDSHEVIDKFLREMHEKYPDLLYEVEIHD